VNHHGSAGGGHYNAQVKSPESGAWNVFDDETVGHFMDGKNPIFGAMNYILFFRKV
jgi:ubiquitin C-terminal hydrolase